MRDDKVDPTVKWALFILSLWWQQYAVSEEYRTQKG